MNIKASLLFASRIFFPKADRSSVARKSLSGAILCIAISLVPLVVVLTISNGMISGITERLISLSSSHIEAISREATGEELEIAAEIVSSTEDVVYSYPMIQFDGLVSYKGKRSGAMIRAVKPELFLESASYKNLFYAEKGSLSDFSAHNNTTPTDNTIKSTKPKILIGHGIAERLGIEPGQNLMLITLEKSGDSVIPKTTSFTVSAIISSGYQEMDSLWVFIPFTEGARLLKKSNGSRCIMIETKDAFSPNIVHIQQKVRRTLDETFRVYRWDELNRSQYENFSSTKMLLIFIMLLIVLVSSINISSALVMLVMERQREIAVLKSIGSDNKGISMAFMIVGFMCGLSGVLLGFPIGILVSLNINQIISFVEKILNFVVEFMYFFVKNDITELDKIHIMDSAYYLQEIPIVIPFKELFLIVFATLLLSLAVSFFPAKKAGKEKPLETLRNTR